MSKLFYRSTWNSLLSFSYNLLQFQARNCHWDHTPPEACTRKFLLTQKRIESLDLSWILAPDSPKFQSRSGSQGVGLSYHSLWWLFCIFQYFLGRLSGFWHSYHLYLALQLARLICRLPCRSRRLKDPSEKEYLLQPSYLRPEMKPRVFLCSIR